MPLRSKPGERMKAPASGVRVRMYRQGHGDCFLLAFPGQIGRSRPAVYVLIDCGYKPKSEIHDQKIDVIAKDILAATGGFVDIVMVTHEHQDHVNGFRKKKNRKYVFEDLEIGQLWLAWTEDPNDAFANQLRKDYNDQLLGLALAEQKLGAMGQDPETLELISDLLELELGDDEPLEPGEAAAEVRELFLESQQNQRGLGLDGHTAFALKGITNKKAIKFLVDKAKENNGVRYLSPGSGPLELPKGADALVYPLGPPRNEDLLTDLDPKGGEEFHLRPFAASGPQKSFFAAAQGHAGKGASTGAPFARKYLHEERDVFRRRRLKFDDNDQIRTFDRPEDYMRAVYGPTNAKTHDPADPNPDGEEWRRIDGDWLDTAETLALRLNDEVNNTSLVVAFELPDTGKVLLFTGDAQRGSWLSWGNLTWNVGGKEVTAKDLLGRCTLYKVGHHGSHNATLNGSVTDSYANIGWLAQGTFADDFTAMIPANTAWARGKKRPWNHPLPKIEEALRNKSKGRIFRSDLDHVSRTRGLAPEDQMEQAAWDAFLENVVEEKLYLEYVIED
ncbi:MAG: hypothetical protein AB8B85_05880 [Paracoccaceae bacterium]